jgi:predicted AAA+ superfamily ATPase
MGRYFLYHMHPLSLAELRRSAETPELHRPPGEIPKREFEALWEHGGYPEPFVKRDVRFSNRWRRLRQQQLLREDVRDLTRVQELGQIEVLGALLASRSAGQIVYSNLAREVKVSVDTMRRWLEVLCSLHWGFLVRPWYRNVESALRKEPKWFLRDWSGVRDPGARAETFVACHLLKAAENWTDLGLGQFELRYLRDKQKREVDFVMVRDDEPWFLVEVKASQQELAPALSHFQAQTRAALAFQVTLDLAYADADCFARKKPVLVPARTFLSQLV